MKLRESMGKTIGRKQKRSKYMKGNRGHEIIASVLVEPTRTVVDDSSGTSRRKRKVLNNNESVQSPLKNMTNAEVNSVDGTIVSRLTKRHKSSLGKSLIEIGKETLSFFDGLTLMASKLGSALKTAIPSLTGRTEVLRAFVSGLGMSALSINKHNTSGMECVKNTLTLPLITTPERPFGSARRATFVTPAKNAEFNPVEFDGDKFYTALDDELLQFHHQQQGRINGEPRKK
jgi:hypothetical protein